MESRRLKAAGDLIAGVPQHKVAKLYDVSRTTVSRWLFTLNNGGKKAMKARLATGRPPKLNCEQLAEVVALCARRGWTHKTLMVAIFNKFGVLYHEDHIYRILHRLGLTKRKKKAA